MEEKRNNGTYAAAGEKAYEAKAGLEAYERAGRNPQLKGIVHEVLYKDKLSMAPENLIKGAKGTLSKSTTAVRDDVLLLEKGSVIGRSQLKDTVSNSGISKTVEQAISKKYVGTELKGTIETVQKYESKVSNLIKQGKSAPQKMSSTGISSETTSRIAAETIGGKITAASLGNIARSSGIAGAAVSGGIEVISSGMKLIDGEIDGSEFAGRVAKETIGGGVSAAAAGTAATAVSAAAATALAATTAPVWIAPALGLGVCLAVGSVAKEIADSFLEDIFWWV